MNMWVAFAGAGAVSALAVAGAASWGLCNIAIAYKRPAPVITKWFLASMAWLLAAGALAFAMGIAR